MKNLTIDMAAKSENFSSNSFLRLYKQNMMLKIMEMKTNEPKLTQKEICNQLGFSDSTIKRYRDDNNMDSPYERIKYKKKITKSETSITEIQTHTPSGKTTNKKNTK